MFYLSQFKSRRRRVSSRDAGNDRWKSTMKPFSWYSLTHSIQDSRDRKFLCPSDLKLKLIQQIFSDCMRACSLIARPCLLKTYSKDMRHTVRTYYAEIKFLHSWASQLCIALLHNLFWMLLHDIIVEIGLKRGNNCCALISKDGVSDVNIFAKFTVWIGGVQRTCTVSISSDAEAESCPSSPKQGPEGSEGPPDEA